jgi:hypothetical protein
MPMSAIAPRNINTRTIGPLQLRSVAPELIRLISTEIGRMSFDNTPTGSTYYPSIQKRDEPAHMMQAIQRGQVACYRSPLEYGS